MYLKMSYLKKKKKNLRRKSKIVSLSTEAGWGRGRVSWVLTVHQDSGLTLHLAQLQEEHNFPYSADEDQKHRRAEQSALPPPVHRIMS